MKISLFTVFSTLGYSLSDCRDNTSNWQAAISSVMPCA